MFNQSCAQEDMGGFSFISQLDIIKSSHVKIRASYTRGSNIIGRS
jgi:hypothetical protein